MHKSALNVIVAIILCGDILVRLVWMIGQSKYEWFGMDMLIVRNLLPMFKLFLYFEIGIYKWHYPGLVLSCLFSSLLQIASRVMVRFFTFSVCNNVKLESMWFSSVLFPYVSNWRYIIVFSAFLAIGGELFCELLKKPIYLRWIWLLVNMDNWWIWV